MGVQGSNSFRKKAIFKSICFCSQTPTAPIRGQQFKQLKARVKAVFDTVFNALKVTALVVEDLLCQSLKGAVVTKSKRHQLKLPQPHVYNVHAVIRQAPSASSTCQ